MKEEKMENIVCPISDERVDENVVRAIAFFALTIIIFGYYTESSVIFVSLAADFALRAFTSGKFSPLKKIALMLSKTSEAEPKLIDAAPKKFSAGLGFVFCITIAALHITGFAITADIAAGVLLICAMLESFLGFCLGCQIYTVLKKFNIIK